MIVTKDLCAYCKKPLEKINGRYEPVVVQMLNGRNAHEPCLPPHLVEKYAKMESDYKEFKRLHPHDYFKGYKNTPHVNCGCPYA